MARTTIRGSRLAMTLAPIALMAACGGTQSGDGGRDVSTGADASDAARADTPSGIDVANDAGLDVALDSQATDSAMPGDAVFSETGSDASTADTRADTGVDGGTSGTTGAGQPGYTCPTTGTVVSVDVGDSSALATMKINNAPTNATICIHGYHRLTGTVNLKTNQHLIGISGTGAALSGALPMATASQWHPSGMPGIWYYNGPEVPVTENLYTNWAAGLPAAFDVATHADDVFYNNQRMMRVLTLAQLPDTGPLPPGQALVPTMMGAETGRFMFDGTSTPNRIYVNRDPTAAGANFEIASLNTVVSGGGTDVRIDNLTVEKAVDTALNSGTNWLITDSTVRFAHHIGLAFPNGTDNTHRSVMTRVLITNNGQYGISTFQNNWITFQDCELSWNNLTNYRTAQSYFASGSSKFWASAGTSIAAPSVIIDNLNSHHNVGAGLWFDGHNQYVVVRGGHYHENEGSGIFYEISCDVDISSAEIDHNGLPILNTDMPDVATSGIHVSHSNNANVHDNVVHDNPLGIVLTWASHMGMVGRCFGVTDPTDVSDAMRNARVHDNTIYQCTGTHSGASLHPFALSSRNDLFTTNHYHLGSTTVGNYWLDTMLVPWAGWHAAGQDMAPGSTITAPCSYP